MRNLVNVDEIAVRLDIGDAFHQLKMNVVLALLATRKILSRLKNYFVADAMFGMKNAINTGVRYRLACTKILRRSLAFRLAVGMPVRIFTGACLFPYAQKLLQRDPLPMIDSKSGQVGNRLSKIPISWQGR
jgi:hypothetical protein